MNNVEKQYEEYKKIREELQDYISRLEKCEQDMLVIRNRDNSDSGIAGAIATAIVTAYTVSGKLSSIIFKLVLFLGNSYFIHLQEFHGQDLKNLNEEEKKKEIDKNKPYFEHAYDGVIEEE